MLKIEYTNRELDIIKSKIHFTERQLRIIEYRQDEWSLVKMADEECCDVSTISREVEDVWLIK